MESLLTDLGTAIISTLTAWAWAVWTALETRATTILTASLVAITLLIAWIHWRTLKYEKRPTLAIAILPKDAEQFDGLAVANRGRGPAVVYWLVYEGQEEPSGLDRAHIANSVEIRYPVTDLREKAQNEWLKDRLRLKEWSRQCETDKNAKKPSAPSIECFIEFTDLDGRGLRQRFRINCRHNAAVPLRCEDLGKVGADWDRTYPERKHG